MSNRPQWLPDLWHGVSSGPRWRSELWRFLELFALCGFVFVQPLLEVVGGSPDFFIFHGVTGGEVLMLVAIVVVVPPLALWTAGVLAGLLAGGGTSLLAAVRARRIAAGSAESGTRPGSPAGPGPAAGPDPARVGRRVRWAAHLLTVTGLAVLLLIQLGKHLTGFRGPLLVAVAVLVTAVIVFAYLRFDAARQLLRFAAIGPLVFAVLFTFTSPSSAVVLADGRPSTGSAPQATGPHPPIVMIVLDEFAMLSLMDSEGNIDAERYPNFARLAGDSTWYRNATATSGWTPYAIPSMMSGRWPAEHRAPHYAIYPDNLFTLLGDVYQISASESITELCPPWFCGNQHDQSRGGLGVALAESTSLLGEIMSPVDHAADPYDDFAEPTVSERLDAVAAAAQEEPDSRVRDAMAISQPVRFHDFITGLEQPLAAGEAPELNFLHLLLPHTPWSYFPDGMRYEIVVGLPVDGQWWGRLAVQRYHAQLQYTDRLLGETLDVLEESGRYDESLVVLTADHGVSLTPGGPAGIRDLEVDQPGIVELAWVPLFIKAPGQTDGVVEDGNWQHVDLLPTIADYAGVAVPWRVDGISWRGERRIDPGKTFYPRLDEPGALDGPAGFAQIMADPTSIPPVPPPPLPELVGTAVADHPVVDGAVRADVENADSFEDVDLATGIVPALVHGTLPGAVPANTPLAIAVNGRIGAVVPVVVGVEGRRRFAGLIENPDLFVAGENRLELFLVPDGTTLHRL